MTHDGMHPTQQALTYGDYWVQFHDLDKNEVYFGYIPTLDQVRLYAARGRAEPRAQDAADAYVAKVARDAQDHVLCSKVHTRWTPDGEVMSGIHKAHVWPIEERLFFMAFAADFDITRLDDDGRVLLDLAFRQQRAHVLPKWGA